MNKFLLSLHIEQVRLFAIPFFFKEVISAFKEIFSCLAHSSVIHMLILVKVVASFVCNDVVFKLTSYCVSSTSFDVFFIYLFLIFLNLRNRIWDYLGWEINQIWLNLPRLVEISFNFRAAYVVLITLILLRKTTASSLQHCCNKMDYENKESDWKSFEYHLKKLIINFIWMQPLIKSSRLDDHFYQYFVILLLFKCLSCSIHFIGV